MAEIRLDLCGLPDSQIEEVFSSDVPLVATCRAWIPGGNADAMEAERKLALAVRSGAHYLDLEIEAPKPVAKRLALVCREWGTVMIRSYHNPTQTPSVEELRAVADKCRHHDAQIVKIVTAASCEEDADRVLSLYKYYTGESLIAFAMARDDDPASRQASRRSRLECLAKGAPFSYCAFSEDDLTAPGQMSYAQMHSAVYQGRKPFSAGPIRICASKSYAQRAILAAALAEGTSILEGYTDCGDSLSAIALAETLGADIVCKRGSGGTSTLCIRGIAARPGCLDAPENSATDSLTVGESGLLSRLAIPLAGTLSSRPIRICGSGTLLSRPLSGLPETMKALGANVSSDTVPLTVFGPVRPGYACLDGSHTSQLVSGAAMALPLFERNSTLKVQSPTSIPYLFMTLDVMRKFSVKVRSEMYGGRRLLDDDWSKCTEIVLKIKENQRYKAASLRLEGDWSAACVFLAAGAIFGEVTLEGLDTTSLQADLCMLDILMDAGASISQTDEPTGTICVRKAPLSPITADISNSPDLFPVVAVFCAFCQGRSSLRGVHRLVHKESDRAEGILSCLTSLGVRSRIKGDDLIVEGQSLDSRILSGNMLKGGRFSCNSDHRMVMALSLAGLGTDSPVIIDNPDCVGKSFPEFNVIWNEYVRKQI